MSTVLNEFPTSTNAVFPNFNFGDFCHLNVSESESRSCVQLFETPWTVAPQAPLPMTFLRQEYWSALSFPSPGDLPNPGIKPRSPALQADSLPTELQGKPCKAQRNIFNIVR